MTTLPKSESLERLAPQRVNCNLIIVDEKGAGYASCTDWHVAYQLRDECEKAMPSKRFSIRHAEMEHPKCHVFFKGQATPLPSEER